MKIAVISAAFPPMDAGEADHALHLCERLARRGEDVHVLTGGAAEGTVKLPFKVDRRMRRWSWAEMPRVARFLRECRPNAILLLYTGWVYNSHPMMTFVPVLAKIFFPAVPFVTQLEIEHASIKASLPARIAFKALEFGAGAYHFNRALGTLLSVSDRVITLSERHRNKLLDRFPRLSGKSLVIPPPPIMRMCSDSGFDRQQARKLLGVKAEDFLLAYFGYLYRGKGLETLLNAVSLLRQRGHEVRLAFIGGGVDRSNPTPYVRSLCYMAERLGVNDAIVWTGEYDAGSDEASRYLFAADACVLPFDDGVTLNRSSIAAASAHGLAIVTTRGKTMESAFVDRENVYLCPPQNPASVADAVITLMADPSLQRSLRLGAIELANRWFSWDRALESTLSAFGSPRPEATIAESPRSS
jgi:glycosyltransferase involved in cell wall biosynthesis